MNTLVLKQTVTYKVIFSKDDFESDKQFNQFCNTIKSDEEQMVNCFIENVDRENLNFASDIEIED
jgi:hypothetical protein